MYPGHRPVERVAHAIPRTSKGPCFPNNGRVFTCALLRSNHFIHRIASLTFIVLVVETLLTVGICATLLGKLRKTHDIFCMSLEMQKVGAWSFFVVGECLYNLVTYLSTTSVIPRPLRNATTPRCTLKTLRLCSLDCEEASPHAHRSHDVDPKPASQNFTRDERYFP